MGAGYAALVFHGKTMKGLAQLIFGLLWAGAVLAQPALQAQLGEVVALTSLGLPISGSLRLQLDEFSASASGPLQLARRLPLAWVKVSKAESNCAAGTAQALPLSSRTTADAARWRVMDRRVGLNMMDSERM